MKLKFKLSGEYPSASDCAACALCDEEDCTKHEQQHICATNELIKNGGWFVALYDGEVEPGGISFVISGEKPKNSDCEKCHYNNPGPCNEKNLAPCIHYDDEDIGGWFEVVGAKHD